MNSCKRERRKHESKATNPDERMRTLKMRETKRGHCRNAFPKKP